MKVGSFMIRAILVDDEKMSLELLERKLLEVGGVEVIKTFTNAKSLINELAELDFQVAFLDIEMPGLTGLDLAEIIQDWNNRIHIVFVTAFNDYAVQAFELDSIDYLLKPVSTKRLGKTIARIQSSFQSHQVNSITKTKNSSLRIICFSEFAVFYSGEPIRWKTAKVKELFAFFITNLHTYMNRDIIINSLWPDLDYHKAKILLHTTISHLRKTLNSLGFNEALKFSNQSYMLEMDNFYWDVMEVEQSIHKLDDIAHNLEEIEHAIQLYTGMYMERNGYEWAEKKRQSINQSILLLFQNMIDYYAANSDSYKLIQYLQLFLIYNPYSEHAIKLLMLQFMKLGNRGEAVRIYQEFASLLQEELGISPDKSTVSLYESIIS